VPRLSFGGRLFGILLLFAIVPSLVLSVALASVGSWALSLVGTPQTWDSVAASGARALTVAKSRPLSTRDSAAVSDHEQALNLSLTQSKRAGFIYKRAAGVVAIAAVLFFALLVFISSRVAGHYSRSLSRPIDELVGWTEHIARAQALPDPEVTKTLGRGAPEFDVLRERMRDMSEEIERGRRSALEAERLSAMRETARQVAHELKNPLTPIKFAVDRLRRDAPPSLTDTIDVLAHESTRLEEMARSFAQFGRLPEGPSAPLDVGELARYTAKASVPPGVALEITVAPDVPLIEGHHEALARALSNVMLNAVEACKDGGTIAVNVNRVARNGGSAVELAVRDTGCGIPPNRLARIWEPYVTYKAGGTGLGLAIARQTVLAHDGEVNAESEPGHGTVIRFILPVRDGVKQA
jgi:signal transduction histidine kinase